MIERKTVVTMYLIRILITRFCVQLVIDCIYIVLTILVSQNLILLLSHASSYFLVLYISFKLQNEHSESTLTFIYQWK